MELRDAFARHPDANVGVVTGVVSGIVVIDLDGDEAVEAYRRLDGAGCKTPVARTGRGWHIYFRLPAGVSLRNFAGKLKGVDGRANGGYVLAPPSRHPSGSAYRWVEGMSPWEIELAELPASVLELFKEPPASGAAGTISFADAPSQHHDTAAAARTAYAEQALAGEVRAVVAAPFGQQEHTLNAAAVKLGGLVGAGVLEFARARDELVKAGLRMANQPGREPWTAEQIEGKVRRGLRDGMRQPRELSEIGLRGRRQNRRKPPAWAFVGIVGARVGRPWRVAAALAVDADALYDAAAGPATTLARRHRRASSGPLGVRRRARRRGARRPHRPYGRHPPEDAGRLARRPEPLGRRGRAPRHDEDAGHHGGARAAQGLGDQGARGVRPRSL